MSQVVHDDKRERLTRTVAAASLLASSIYIVWRWGWTLEGESLWFSLPLVLAETYGILASALLTYTAWSLRVRRPLPVLPDRTVDVFVTTKDEPIAIIRKTALAAREIRYPHTTWLLDDGLRDEVRTVAEEIGIRYLRRERPDQAKAGNLNHALQHATGEFILQLDADHVALPHIIDRLIGFFEDERLAFAQSPQDFYNTDAFTEDVNGRGRQLWGDQQLFFNVLQPGKDRLGAALFVGSCAMIRRAAIEDIGGFAAATTIVGTETSILLHARGWRSAYFPESLAFGLAPATAHAYQVQQLHRAQGAMQALRRYQPLAIPGLTRAQRIEYFHTLTTPLGSVQRLIFYLAPIVFLTTGVFPIRSSIGVFAAFFIPAVCLRAISFRLLTRGQGSLLHADRYWMAKFFTHLIAVRSYLTPRRLSYRVRVDEAGAVPLRTVAPQLTLIGITALALAWASYARTLGYGTDVPGWGSLALIAAVLVALWHAGLAGHVAQLSLAGRHRRAEFRFAESLSVGLRVLREDGKLASTDIAMTEDLTATGLALRCMYPLPERARVELSLPLSSGVVNVRGHVVRHSTSETQFGTVHRAGIEFDATSRETRDAIELHCAQHAMPIEQQRQRQGAMGAGALRRLRELRGERRVDVGMPARVIGGAGADAEDLGVGLLEDVSPRGGRVLLDHPIEEGREITLQIPGSSVHASGRVVFVHALETRLGMRFVAGFETPMDPSAAADTPAPWYAAVVGLLNRTRTAAAGSVAAAGLLAKGSRAAAVKVVGESQSVAARLASGSKVAAEKVAVGSRDAAARIATGSRVAAEKVVGGSRAVVEVVAAGSAAAAGAATRTVKSVRSSLPVRTGPAPATGAADVDALADPDEAIERIALEAPPEGRRWTPIAASVAIPSQPVSPAEPLVATPSVDEEVAVAAADSAPSATLDPVPDIDPERVVEMEVTGEFSFPMELTVGATFLIGESGRVAADISTVHAIVLGSYSGILRASRSIRLGPSARVEGVLETPDLEIAEGAVVNGLGAFARADDAAIPQTSPLVLPEKSVTPPLATPAVDESAVGSSGNQGDEQAADDEIFVASPIFTEGVSRG